MKLPNIPHLDDVLLLLAAAIIVVPIFRHLKLSPVLGYLTAGAVIGPYALGGYLGYSNADVEHLQHVAELGVIFLLFLIGLELPLERLKVMRKMVFGLGLCQVLFTTLVFSGIALYMGFPFEASLVIGGALALSSTAMVLQLLSERHEMSSKHGRATFSVLLFQDLAVVPLLAITMVLGENAQGIDAVKTLGIAFGKGVLAIGIIIIFGRYRLRPLFKFFESAKNQDIFTAATLFIVLAVSTATGYLGLSMALGAFLAGMMIAGTEYRHEVEKQVMPFQGLLLGLFFMSIGMTINFKLIANDPALVLGLVAGLMVVKGIIVFLLARGFGIAKACSMRTAVLLAQGGEFAFVVIKLAMDQGVVLQSDGTMVFIAVTISMVLTPIMVSIFKTLQPDESLALDAVAAELKDQENHVILIGFSRVGKSVAGMLSRKIPPMWRWIWTPNRFQMPKNKACRCIMAMVAGLICWKLLGQTGLVVW